MNELDIVIPDLVDSITGEVLKSARLLLMDTDNVFEGLAQEVEQTTIIKERQHLAEVYSQSLSKRQKEKAKSILMDQHKLPARSHKEVSIFNKILKKLETYAGSGIK